MTDAAPETVTESKPQGVTLPATIDGVPVTVPANLRADLHQLLEDLEADALKWFGHHPAKLEQLAAHSKTLHMVIDDLHDTTPPPPPASL